MLKKVGMVVLALAFSMAFGATAFADEAADDATAKPSSGNGTITIENADKGETYAAYQVFGATYNDTTKSVAYTISTSSPWYSAVSSNDSVFTLTDSDSESYKYVSLVTGKTEEEVISFLSTTFESLTTNNGNTLAPTKSDEATGGSIVWENVPYGYYYITSTQNTAVTVDTNTPNVTVYDKNISSPTPGGDNGALKEIIEGATTETKNGATYYTASIGDTVKFRVRLNTVNYVTSEDEETGTTESTQVVNYVVTDTPTSMAIDKDTISVKVGETTLTSADYTATVDSTDGTDGKLTVTVPWVNDDGNSLYDNGDVLVVEYSAEVTGAAVTNGSANNSAVAYYNTDTEISDGSVTVNNYSFDLKKVDSTDQTKTLAGATFEFYKDADHKEKISLVATDTEGVYRLADSADSADSETTVVTSVTTGESGTITVKGLGNGTYYVVETKAPDGYNKLTTHQSLSIDGANLSGDATVSVVNKRGTELPSTGGMGTTLFYVVGGLLVVGAAVTMVVKKRMTGYED